MVKGNDIIIKESKCKTDVLYLFIFFCSEHQNNLTHLLFSNCFTP